MLGVVMGSYLGAMGDVVLNREHNVLDDVGRNLVTINRKLLAK